MNLGLYRDLQKIGQGRMGEAYKARDSRDGRIVAIKAIHVEPSELLTARSVLLRESEKLKLLKHSGIPAVYEVTHQDSSLYIVTEFLVGDSLDRLLKAGQKLPLSRRLEIIKQSCTVLHEVHEHGILHKALTPSKIFVQRDNSVKILGFGVSAVGRFLNLELPIFLRDLNHSSPEEIRCERRIGRESDIWSIGVTLFELLQGRLPFVGGNLEAFLFQVVRAEVPATPAEVPFAGELDRIFARALAKEVENRYRSAGELAADLETLIPKVKQCEEEMPGPTPD